MINSRIGVDPSQEDLLDGPAELIVLIKTRIK